MHDADREADNEDAATNAHLPVYLSICLSVYLSICLSIYRTLLSICLRTYPRKFLFPICIICIHYVYAPSGSRTFQVGSYRYRSPIEGLYTL